MRENVSERWNIAKRFQLCFRCLEEGHEGKSCRKTRRCGTNHCHKVHHRLLHVNPETRMSTVSKTTSDTDRKLLSGSKPSHEWQGPDTVSSDLSCGTEGNTIKEPRGTEDGNAWPWNTIDGQALNAIERKEYGIQKSYSTVNDVSHGCMYSGRGTSASSQLEELDCGHPGRQTTSQ